MGDKARKPSLDDQNTAKLLASLKHSRVAPNLNLIAKAANCDCLDLDDEVREQLEYADADVIAMRNALDSIIKIGVAPPCSAQLHTKEFVPTRRKNISFANLEAKTKKWHLKNLRY